MIQEISININCGSDEDDHEPEVAIKSELLPPLINRAHRTDCKVHLYLEMIESESEQESKSGN